MRRGEGRQRNGRGRSVGRSARIVSRLRIIGESGLRACGGRRDHARLGGSGLGTHRDHGDLQHFRRDVRERPSKVLVTRRQRLLERVLHGATPTPHADGAAAVHCGGELSSTISPLRRADERAAPRLFTCCARRPIPRPSNPTADAAAVQIPPSAAPRGWLCADTAASDGPREAATGGSVGENQI